MLLAAEQAAHATVVARHSGSTNPSTEGFVNDYNVLPVYGSPVSPPPAWNMTGPWNTDYNQYVLTSAQVSMLGSQNWKLTAIMENLSAGTGAESGIYVGLDLGAQEYDLELYSDGAGNQVLSTNPFSWVSPPAQPYTIAGLGPAYATFVMDYNAQTGDLAYSVNGSLTISSWPGFVNPYYSGKYAGEVYFGGVEGNFQLVSLTTGVPEPASWVMLLAGFGGVGFAAARRASQTSRIATG
jgi:hypothetical protein